jgi:hypothetical protein
MLEATFLLQNVGMTNSPFSSESWLRCGALPFEHEQEQEQERGEPISQQPLTRQGQALISEVYLSARQLIVLIVAPKLFIEPGTKAPFPKLLSVSGPGL